MSGGTTGDDRLSAPAAAPSGARVAEAAPLKRLAGPFGLEPPSLVPVRRCPVAHQRSRATRRPSQSVEGLERAAAPKGTIASHEHCVSSSNLHNDGPIALGTSLLRGYSYFREGHNEVSSRESGRHQPNPRSRPAFSGWAGCAISAPEWVAKVPLNAVLRTRGRL